jgi:hypothetical protein
MEGKKWDEERKLTLIPNAIPRVSMAKVFNEKLGKLRSDGHQSPDFKKQPISGRECDTWRSWQENKRFRGPFQAC